MLYRATVADVSSRGGDKGGILKSKTSPKTTTATESSSNKSSSSTTLWASRRIKKKRSSSSANSSGRLIMSISMTVAIVIMMLFCANLFMLSHLTELKHIEEGQEDEGHSSPSDAVVQTTTTTKSSSSFEYKRPLLPGSIWSTRKFPTYNNQDQNHDQDNNNNNIDITHLLSDNETARALELCGKFYYSTLKKATKVIDSGDQVYVATGDIDMMWIRDSVVQFSIYLSKISTTPWLRLIVEGEIKRNAFNIIQDPYANAYRQNWKSITNFNMKDQLIGRGGYIGTRNYELDSGAYYLNHIYDYYVTSGIYKPETLLEQPIIYDAVNLLVDIWIIEQNHDTMSEYRYFELPNNGRGTPTTYTGMTWTGFRPSDDATQFGYLIPANIHAAAGLERVLILNERIWKCNQLEEKTMKLLEEIEDGINKYGIVNITTTTKNSSNNNNNGDNNKNKKNNGTTAVVDGEDEQQIQQQQQIYAYEVDGMGGILKKYDDANVPSLLSIPLLGWSKYNPKIYKSTRSMLLSKQNPVYYEGSSLKGIGSRHTRSKMIWPMSLIIQGLTEQYAAVVDDDGDGDNDSDSNNNSQRQHEQQQMMIQNNMAFQLKQILISSSCKTKGDYSLSLHESVHVDNTCAFSRYWFEWANALFVVYVETVMSSSQQNQCSTIGNELYQREISQKIPPKETKTTNTNTNRRTTTNNAAAVAFRPHIDPYKNDRNLPQYFQNIAASVQYDSYEPQKQIKDNDF